MSQRHKQPSSFIPFKLKPDHFITWLYILWHIFIFLLCFVNCFGQQKIMQHISFDIWCRSIHMHIPISITHCLISRLTRTWGQINILHYIYLFIYLSIYLFIRIFADVYSPHRFVPPCLLKHILYNSLLFLFYIKTTHYQTPPTCYLPSQPEQIRLLPNPPDTPLRLRHSFSEQQRL